MKSRTPALTGTVARRGVVGFLVVMEFGSGILQGWYAVLLGAIGTEFRATEAQLNWVNVTYLLASVVLVPIIATLGDRYGHKRMLSIAAAAVALGSIVVAVAPSFVWLLVGRALQGALASFLPLEFAIVRDRDPERAGRSIGKLIGALTFGAAIGSLVAGLSYSALGNLRPVLWIPAVILTICVPVVAFLVPESKTRAQGRVDWAGAALLGMGLLTVLTGISNAAAWGWTNPVTWITILCGVALLTWFSFVERRVSHPLIDFEMLTRGGIGLPIVMAVLLGAQLFGAQTATMLFMLAKPSVAGYGLGFPPAAVGFVALTSALGMFLASSVANWLSQRIGFQRTLVVAGVFITLGYCALIFASALLPVVLASLVVSGLGNGLAVAVLATLIVTRAPADSVGIASALYNTSRTAAGAVAGAIFALIMSSFMTTIGSGQQETHITAFTGYVAVWVVCGLMAFTFTVLVSFLRKPSTAMGASSPTQKATVPAN